MTNGHLGLLMLAMIVVAIMLGFPTAFTLMGLGTMFAWFAYRSQNPETAVAQTLDLMALRAYAVMCNDVLISVPLFVFMGYLVERANLIQRLFKGLHLATASIPGSLAVATIVTCAIFSTASGIIGAVVTVMGLLAFPAMLKAGYGVKLAAGAVTAGGTLGILIPPSVLLILYGATAGVSVVQLYAGAFFPGIMLAGLYVIYVIVCAKLWPSAAPRLSEEERRVDLPKFAEFISRTMSRNALAGTALAIKGKRNAEVPMAALFKNLFIALLPFLATALLMGSLYLLATEPEEAIPEGVQVMGFAAMQQATEQEAEEELFEPGVRKPIPGWWWITLSIFAGLLAIVYAVLTFVRLEIFKMLLTSFFPLALIILGVLGTIIVGLATPAEAAAMGAFGGLVLAAAYRALNWRMLKEAVFLCAKTSAMVCWLFVGSSIFAAAFRAARRPGNRGHLGEIHGPVAGAVHDSGADHHLSAGLAAGMDRDHRHLHAHLCTAPVPLRYQPAFLRTACGAQPADGIPVAAGGHGGFLPERGVAPPRDVEPDLPRDDAVHGDPGGGNRAPVPVSINRLVAALSGVQQLIRPRLGAPAFENPSHSPPFTRRER
jgi:TRAP-type mannitol/chloroaromatic compound transport system permease large subunit